MVTLTCSFCGRTFEREKRSVNKTSKNFYCNHHCMANGHRKGTVLERADVR